MSDPSIIIYCLCFQSVFFFSLCWIPHIWSHHSRVPFCHVDLALHLSQLRNSDNDVGGKTRFLPPCNGHSVQLGQAITRRMLSKPLFACIFRHVCGQVEALPLTLFSLVAAYKWRTLVWGLPESNRSHGLNPITLNYFCRALCLLGACYGLFSNEAAIRETLL